MSTSELAKSAAKVAIERMMGTTRRYLKGAVWMGGARSHLEEVKRREGILSCIWLL